MKPFAAIKISGQLFSLQSQHPPPPTHIISLALLIMHGMVHCYKLHVTEDLYSCDTADSNPVYDAFLITFYVSRAMRKCVLCHMRTTKAQISLGIRAV